MYFSKYEVPTPPYKLGLSVSHDSIFSPDNGSNSINPEELNRPQGSSLSVQHAGIKNMFKDELFNRVRARRDSDDDDVGLPHSPCTSPTTVDVLTQGLKEKSSKSQTTCSAGSLISMGSSENDDDSAGQLSSGHSSRMSLLDRRSVDSEGDADLCQSVPLNHKAAHHKIAVRPKRTHGLPQRRLKQLAASAVSTLPSTPEVMEDNGKSFTKMESFQMIETSSVTMTTTEMASTTSQLEEISIKQCDVAISEETSSSTVFGRQMLHIKQTVNSETFTESRSETWNASRNLFTNQDEAELSDLEPVKPSVSREGSYSGLSDISSDTSIKEKRSSFTKSDEENFMPFMEKASPSPDGISFKPEKIVSDNIPLTEPAAKSDAEETEQSAGSDLVTLRVSAIVKTLEQSECSYGSEKTSSVRKSGTVALSKTEIRDSTFSSENSCFVSETSNSNEYTIKQGDVNEAYIEKVKNQLLHDGKNDFEPDIVSNVNLTSLSDVHAAENEICINTVKSPIQTDQDKTNVPHSETFETEKQNLHQKRTTEQTTDLLSMRSSFHEEESIMSEKNVPVIEPKISPAARDSKIFISHGVVENVSEITEAHNLVTVDSSFVTNVRTLDSVSSMQKTHAEEPWVSSVDIGPCVLPSPTSDMTVHSLVSQVANKINVKDKITISVNSSTVEESEIVSAELLPAKSEIVSPVTDHETPTTEVKEAKTISEANPVVPDKNLNIKPKTKDEPKKSPSDRLPQKNLQKRVSVEIVPFSQRMKERKYQPVIYSKDTAVSEPMKTVSQTAVERKLSDCTSPSDQTAQHVKGNNRHSFSGLPTEIAKVESFSEDKKIKVDKIPRPVHIRIHKENAKSSTSISEKPTELNLNAEKSDTQQSKLNKRVVKSFVKPSKEAENEEKSKSNTGGSVSGGAPPKWEVKIQPAANSTKSNLTLSFPKEKTEDLVHTALDNQVELQDKFSDTNSDVDSYDLSGNLPFTASGSKDVDSRGSTPSLTSESPPIKSRENSWRSSKESFPPSDMEPELYRVFARRSIKQKNDKSDDAQENTSGTCSSDDSAPCDTPEKSEGSNQIINISNNSTVIKISEKNEVVQEKSSDLSKKKSKSFNEKDKQTVKSYPVIQQTSLNSRKQAQLPTETHPAPKDSVHRRQRLASVPDILPPPVDIIEPEKNQQNGTYPEEDFSVLNKSESLQRASSLSISTSSTLSNGSSGAPTVDILKAKENVDAGSKDSSTPSWLQLAQQRRELREQRERLLLGSSTSSFVLESSSKPSRSSKVWDMVNSFQKMQMT